MAEMEHPCRPESCRILFRIRWRNDGLHSAAKVQLSSQRLEPALCVPDGYKFHYAAFGTVGQRLGPAFYVPEAG